MTKKLKQLELESIIRDIESVEEEIKDWFFSDRATTESDIQVAFWHLKKNILEDIKSACEFYLRYKDNPNLLLNEQRELAIEEKEIDRFYDGVKGWRVTEYNEWLFRLIFKEVLGDENVL